MGNYVYSYKRKATKMKNYFQRAIFIYSTGLPMELPDVVSTHCSLDYSIWGMRNTDPRKILTAILTLFATESGCRAFGQT